MSVLIAGYSHANACQPGLNMHDGAVGEKKKGARDLFKNPVLNDLSASPAYISENFKGAFQDTRIG